MMKKNIPVLVFVLLVLVACGRDEGYRCPEGYENIFYSYFDYEYDDLGNPVLSSTTLNLDKTSADPVELGVKLMSSGERDFDVEVRLYIRTSKWFLEKINAIRKPGMFSTPDSLAVPGLDYLLLDADMNAMSPVRTDSVSYYRLVFPKARKDTKKIYIQTLDNQDYSCPRYAWLSLALTHPGYDDEESLKVNTVNNISDEYQVKTITRSWLRSLVIK